MKQVLFVRHAKSSWADPVLKDKDRPLNKRGVRDAPLMAKRCIDAGLKVDLVLSSPAVRAMSTAIEFHKAYKITAEILTESNLYHGDVDDYEDALRLVDDEVQCVAIFGHNPGLTYLANELFSNRYIDNVPTCGVVVATADIDYWEDFAVKKSDLRDFLYPKQLI